MFAAGFHFGERVNVGDAFPHSRLEKLPRPLNQLAHRRLGRLLNERLSPIVGVAFAYLPQILVFTEVFDQGMADVLKLGNRGAKGIDIARRGSNLV